MNKHGVLIAFCLRFFVVVILGELHQITQVSKKDDDLRFLVVGDWGRKGLHGQSEIAAQMTTVAKTYDIDFVVSTGDNFYDDGLRGTDDKRFKKSFQKIYKAESLQVPWYIVLGNHDYMGVVSAQLSPILKERDGRWICYRSFIVNTEVAEFFFIDTTPFVNWYFTTSEVYHDQRGLDPDRNAYVDKLLEDLDSALANSNGKWKIVIGHHTIWSTGQHGNTKDVKNRLLPLLIRHNVDFYINGHDHSMQRIIPSENNNSPVEFITSGGGSRAWAHIRHYLTAPCDMKEEFYYDGQGFMLARVQKDSFYGAFYDINGAIIHNWMTEVLPEDQN